MPAIAKSILIVEPEPNMRQVLQMCLSRLSKWQIIVATSAPEALLQAETRQPDAILLEHNLLAMSAIAFLQHLHGNPKTTAIPVIFLTVEVNLTERQRFLALGAVGAIAKPFNPLTLVPQIAAILGWDLEQP